MTGSGRPWSVMWRLDGRSEHLQSASCGHQRPIRPVLGAALASSGTPPTLPLARSTQHPAHGAAEGRPPSCWTHHRARCAAYHLLMNTPYFVRAEWDDEAAVWVASSDDVPGLVTEAATLEGLDTKLRSMVPELLEANGCMPADGQVAVELLARRFSVALPAAA